MIANGECGQNSVKLFYENPEEFQKHQNVFLSYDLISNWQEKYKKQIKKYIKT
jgi:hypothetical protein